MAGTQLFSSTTGLPLDIKFDTCIFGDSGSDYNTDELIYFPGIAHLRFASCVIYRLTSTRIVNVIGDLHVSDFNIQTTTSTQEWIKFDGEIMEITQLTVEASSASSGISITNVGLVDFSQATVDTLKLVDIPETTLDILKVNGIAQLTVTNVVLEGCNAQNLFNFESGLQNFGSSYTIDGVTWSEDNPSYGTGAAVIFGPNIVGLTVRNGEFYYNKGIDTSLFAVSCLTVRNCTFSGKSQSEMGTVGISLVDQTEPMFQDVSFF